MNEWWSSLSLESQIFYVIGIVALLINVVQMTMTLIGIGADSLDLDVPDLDLDTDIDLSDAHAPDPSASGIGLFSSQTIVTFFLGFGWTGVVGESFGFPLWLTLFIAFAVGGMAMIAMWGLIVGMLSLQGRGNLDYRSAVGGTAEVYVTLPGDGQDGGGQINVMIQGRLTTATARKETPGAVKPGTTVYVVGMAGPTTFLVDLPDASTANLSS